MRILTFIALTGLLFSCSNPKEDIQKHLVDVSNFTIDNKLMTENEKVTVLGASNKITEENKGEFYELIVAVCQSTNDTINILAYNYSNLYNNSDLTFIPAESKNGKLMILSELNLIPEGRFREDEIRLPKYDKVFYDKEFISYDIYKYPAVVGLVGEYTITTTDSNAN